MQKLQKLAEKVIRRSQVAGTSESIANLNNVAAEAAMAAVAQLVAIRTTRHKLAKQQKSWPRNGQTGGKLMEHGIVLRSVWVAVGFVVFVVWRKVGADSGNLMRDLPKYGLILTKHRLCDEALAELKNYQHVHRAAADEAKPLSGCRSRRTHS